MLPRPRERTGAAEQARLTGQESTTDSIAIAQLLKAFHMLHQDRGDAPSARVFAGPRAGSPIGAPGGHTASIW